MTRKSINPPSVPAHKNPIPVACVMGNILMSSAIMGHDPDSGGFSEDKEAQIASAFAALRATLVHAGATPDDVIKLDLFFTDKNERALVNPHWVAMFPDPGARPARHSHLADLPKGCCLQISVTAVIGAS